MGALRRVKTKRLTRGLDQVKSDLTSPSHLKRHLSTKTAEDLPGLGEFYCVECAKHFEGDHNLVEHRRGKNHKRRVRMLRGVVHDQALADRVVGLGREERKSNNKKGEMEVDLVNTKEEEKIQT